MNGTSPYVVDLEHAFVSESIAVLKEHAVLLHIEREIGSATLDLSRDSRACTAVCSRFASGRPDMFVTIGSGISAYVHKEYSHIPQVFLAVTDPIGSEIVRSLEPDSSRGEVCGVTFSVGAEERLAFIRDVFHPRKVGFVYNPKYSSDVQQLARFIDAATNLKSVHPISIKPLRCESPILDQQAQSELDCIAGWLYFHEHICEFLQQSSVPCVGGGWVDLRRGACCCVADDEREMGRLAANAILVEHVINGKPLALMPIYKLKGPAPRRLFTGFNLDAAARWHVRFPDALLEQADCIISEKH